MGRKFIIEEVEEKSELGCGSIVAMVIIAIVFGLCGGFKSCNEDQKTEAVKSRTEQPQRLDKEEAQTPNAPKSSNPSASAPTSTTASSPRKEASVEPVAETSCDDDTGTEKAAVSTAPTQQDNSIVTETDSETPALTEKERRKAERQAKRDARRREKAELNE